MALREGDLAPLLPGVPAATGPQVVYFMRTSSCAVCQKHVRRLIDDDPRIAAAGADVVIVVPDGGQEAGTLAARLSAPFPIVSSLEAYAAVGLVPKVFGQLQQSGTLVMAGGHCAPCPYGDRAAAGLRSSGRAGGRRSAVKTRREPGWFTRNVFNRAVRRLTRLGISVWGSRELRVRGRRSGQWRTTPVNLLTIDGQRYLVAPRGVTRWVRNLRAAGGGELRIGRRIEAFHVDELSDDLLATDS